MRCYGVVLRVTPASSGSSASVRHAVVAANQRHTSIRATSARCQTARRCMSLHALLTPTRKYSGQQTSDCYLIDWR